MEIALAVWIFVLGAAVGSFLNVVIYRLPAGMSLSRPGSHCPLCGHAIRWYDNVPILGWLLLRGRCRDCRAPISPRYPLVEFAVAAMFLTAAWADGLIQPAAQWLILRGEEGPTTIAVVKLAVLSLADAALLCTLTASAWIEYDGRRPPVRLFAPALLTGLVGSAGVLNWGLAYVPQAVAGICVGAGLTVLAHPVVSVERRRGMGFSAAGIGLYFGWQFAAIATLLVTAIHVGGAAVFKTNPSRRQGSPGFLWIATALALMLLRLAITLYFPTPA